MTDYYISKTGDDNSGTADDPNLPYETLDTVEGLAANGDTVYFYAGAYDTAELQCNIAAEDYINMDKAISLRAYNGATVSFTASDVSFLLRYNGGWTGDTITVEGIDFVSTDGAPSYAIAIRNQSATAGTINITDCTFSVNNLYSLFWDTASAGPMNINISGCTESSATTRSFVYFDQIDGGSAVTIDDCTITSTANTNSTGGIAVIAKGASATLSITNNTMDYTSNGAIGRGVRVFNIDDALIDGNTVTMRTSATDTSVAIQVDVNDAALTSHKAIMRNNTIYNYCDGGHCLFIGHETSNAYDNLMNDGFIFNNSVTGDDTFREGTGHSVSFGYCTDGNSCNNKIDQVALGLLCKGATGGGHFANYITNFGKESTDGGSALQSKSCANTKYFGNTIIFNSTCYGAGFVANDDGVTDNTGVECESNIFKVTEATDPATAIMSTTDVNQDVTFKKNAYINADLLEATHTTNQAMAYQGTSRDIAYWEANVEDDASFDNDDTSLLIVVVDGSGGFGVGGGSVTGKSAIINHNIIG